MTASEIRQRFLTFFRERGHTVVPSAPLVPENDPSVLFNTAGMQPLVPYLMGQPHPTGSKRIADVQKCLRTNDIEEVGDNTHLTFFEMLGNWSLGDYFKKDAIAWSYEFLTSKEEGLGLDPTRLYVTVFEGDENAPPDKEAYSIWEEIFEKEGLDPTARIFFMDAESNWWSPGDDGPCGPDSEMFYDVTGKLTNGLSKDAFIAADDRQDVVEIWNDVFMEYEKKGGNVVGKLVSQNVDTGSGLERVVGVVQGKDNVFETDLFLPILNKITELSDSRDERSERIVADHVRAATFLIADGVAPSNTDRGYVLRRLIRRAVRHADKLGMPQGGLEKIVEVVIEEYQNQYPELGSGSVTIQNVVDEEEQRFRKTLTAGLKALLDLAAPTISEVKEGEKVPLFKSISSHGSGKELFFIFATYGFPLENSLEEINKIRSEPGMGGPLTTQQVTRIRDEFLEEMRKHQERSRAGAEQKFKGGLADTGKETVQLHTATHLMLAGLRKYLGDHVHQAGSNITTERTRFDFTHPEKVDRETLDKVEAYVNEAIQKGSTVEIEQMPKDEAKAAGVEGSFWEKYPDTVNVYKVAAPDGTVYSRELCGGPHVEHTRDMGTFKIVKEEAVAAGVRRIKAVLE